MFGSYGTHANCKIPLFATTIDVVKKMLAPLRTGNYPVVQLPHYVDAMKTVVFNHFSTETVRNLATFLVSTLKQSK